MKTRHPVSRLLALTILLCAAICLLAACGEDDIIQPIAGETSAALTGDYSIICVDRSSEEMLSLAKSLRDEIKARTGLDLRIAYANTEAEYEILLGYNADRNACEEAYEGLTAPDYGVYASGSKIVLSGYTLENLSAAAELFLDHALKQTDSGWEVGSYTITTEAELAINGDLSGYQIVYPADDSYCQTLANELKLFLFERYGAMLRLVEDTAESSEYEIVIGNTSRGTPAPEGVAAPQPHEWVIAAQGHRVYLYGENPAVTALAVRTFCEQSVNAFTPKVLYVESGTSVGSIIDTQDSVPLTDGAEVRVMSYNILHESWSNVEDNVPVAPRAEKLTALLLYYRPDVVGIQEVSADWHENLDTFLVDTGYYSKACEYTGSSKHSMTSFLYNPETVELVDSYVIDMDANSDIRVISVAVFKCLATGEQFVVTNTHPAPTSQEAYPRHIDFIVENLNTIRQKHKDLPVIMTGDFNTKESSSYYNTLLTMPVRDAKYCAEILVRNYESFLSPKWGGSPIAGDQKSLDHIFCTDDVRVLLFNTVIDNQVDTISDHLPIYADVILD